MRYKKCPRCTEAVNASNQQENEHHFKNKQCTPFDKRMMRCPLCHTNISPGEDMWKEHLMNSQSGCVKNVRKASHHAPGDQSKKNSIQQKK